MIWVPSEPLEGRHRHVAIYGDRWRSGQRGWILDDAQRGQAMSYLIVTIAAGGLLALIPLVSYWDGKDEEKRRRQ